MEIIKVRNGQYEQYEELLLKREHFLKEASQYLIGYTREFGELTAEVFEIKIRCIRLKKEIAWCQKKLNMGGKIDINAMKAEMDRMMAMYYAELADMVQDAENAKRFEYITPVKVQQVKRIYRELAKKLHPDINPGTKEQEKLKDLWNRISIAYYHNDLEELRELKVLTTAALKELGDDGLEVEIPDLDQKIARLEDEISNIVTTEPYTYKELLRDPVKIEEKRRSLEAEKAEYLAYRDRLQETMDTMLLKQGGHLIWQMN